jgi:transposase
MTTIKYNLLDFDFVDLSHREAKPRTRIRLLTLAHLKDGKTQAQTAEALKTSPTTVKRTYKRFKDSGILGLDDLPKTGAKFKLPKNQHEEFKKYILERQEQREGGRLTGYDIHEIIIDKWNVTYSLGGVYRLLHHLGLSWISSRSKHPEQDEEAQENFKKKIVELIIEALPEGVDLSTVDIWFQDETRVGQQGDITRVWAPTGTRPRAIRQQQFINAYIFGAVCPSRDQAVGLVLPCVNMDAMKLHMEEISKNVPEGRHALVIVDGAGWHQKYLNLENVTQLKLPPYSPELNPVEQIWQWLKQKWLSNRVYDSYEHIVDASCDAWNKMVTIPGIINSICSRDWASLNGVRT